MNNSQEDSPIEAEPMVDAKQAACALRLPLYWFADQKLRAKYRIPHYLMGGLVRFRMAELSTWAANSRVAGGSVLQTRQQEGAGHDGL
jgi:hypothetical protein